MNITQETTELEVNEQAMHKTRRGDKTYYWSWDTNGIGCILKHLCFVDGEITSSGDEFMHNESHKFVQQFDWALTPKQAKDLYTLVTNG